MMIILLYSCVYNEFMNSIKDILDRCYDSSNQKKFIDSYFSNKVVVCTREKLKERI